jgi:radical SAM superfamily enzyme YgiQ (UPF0313 family)
MKILLGIFFNNEAYGLRILHSILSKNHDCKMLFIDENNQDLILEVIKEYNPDVVGFSLVSSNFPLYKSLYNKIRESGNFKIILGGWQATLNPEKCFPYCDIVCRGEGEEIIEKIIEDINNNNFLKTYIGTLVKKIDYPLFAFDNECSYHIDKGKILNTDPYYKNYRYGTMIGRGCPHNCTYCSNSYMKNIYPQWSKIRFRDYDVVIEELKIAKEKLTNIEIVVFYDEVFLPHKDDMDYFLKRYKEEIGIPFYCLFYPGTCSKEKAKKLKEAGLEGVWMGVQSGSERIRKEIFKRYGSNEKILEQAKIFHENDLKIRYDFIFENPFEVGEEFEETINLIKSFPKPFTLNFFQMKFFPNTELTKMALEKGIIDKLDDDIFCECPDYKISKEKQEEIWKLIND